MRLLRLCENRSDHDPGNDDLFSLPGRIAWNRRSLTYRLTRLTESQSLKFELGWKNRSKAEVTTEGADVPFQAVRGLLAPTSERQLSAKLPPL